MAEFANFVGAVNSNMKARGVPVNENSSLTDDQKKAWYDLFNAKTPGTDGVTLDDFLGVTKDVQEAMAA